MKQSYRIIEVTNDNDIHYKLQRRYLLIFWKSIKFPGDKKYTEFSTLEAAVRHMNRLRCEQKTTHRTVYQDV
jgi:hypothetical protein